VGKKGAREENAKGYDDKTRNTDGKGMLGKKRRRDVPRSKMKSEKGKRRKYEKKNTHWRNGGHYNRGGKGRGGKWK